MPIFPVIETVTEETIIKPEERETLEPLFDFKNKRLVMKDGKIIYCTELEKIKQWVELLLRTELDKYKVYVYSDFGMETIYKYRGYQVGTSNFAKSEIKRELKSKIERHKGIERVKNLKVDSNFNTVNIELTLVLKNKKEVKQEVSL